MIYVQTNNNNVIQAASRTYIDNWIAVDTDEMISVTNQLGEHVYKLVDGNIVLRSDAEIAEDNIPNIIEEMPIEDDYSNEESANEIQELKNRIQELESILLELM